MLTVNTRNDRKIENYIKQAIYKNYYIFSNSRRNYLDMIISNYLALSNVYYFDQINNKIVKTFSLIRATENEWNGYRVFNYGWTNLSVPSDYPYFEFVEKFSAKSLPPRYLNFIMQIQKSKSNFLFSILYLLAPVVFLLQLILLFSLGHKIMIDIRWFLSFVCIGSAFLNVVQHVFMLTPIDRYIFWGYPLLLFSVFIILIEPFWGGKRFVSETSEKVK